MLLTFIPAAGDYVNAYFLGGPNQAMIGNAIQGQYLELSNYPVAAALSFILLALIMVAVVVYLRLAGTRNVLGDDDRGTEHVAAAPASPFRGGGPGAGCASRRSTSTPAWRSPTCSSRSR